MSSIHILAIDTSCDDTAVSVLHNDCVLANVVSSQVEIHSQWGGVVPRLAKRAHEEQIQPCIELALKRSGKPLQEMDVIAVTYGPGLAPALEVGVTTAKQIAVEHDKHLIAVNHMEGHVLSPLLRNSKGNFYIDLPEITFPFLAMSISGGHTEIVEVSDIGKYRIVGQTLDDAAGEALDKVARMLELGYPGGPIVEKMAEKGDQTKIPLPRPMSRSNDFNYSFSGLKTACLYKIRDIKEELQEQFSQIIPDFCACLQEAVVDTLLIKLKKAVKHLDPKMIVIAGGVSSNNHLRTRFRKEFSKKNIPVIFPEKKFCMDNAAMIGLVAYYKYQRQEFVKDKQQLDRDPALTIEDSNVYE